MNDVRAIVAGNIRRYREQARLEQKELAIKVGVTVQAICNYEKNVSSPSIDKLALICDALGVRPTVMMGLVEEHATREEEAEVLHAKYRQAPEHIQKTVDTLLERK